MTVPSEGMQSSGTWTAADAKPVIASWNMALVLTGRSGISYTPNAEEPEPKRRLAAAEGGFAP